MHKLYIAQPEVKKLITGVSMPMIPTGRCKRQALTEFDLGNYAEAKKLLESNHRLEAHRHAASCHHECQGQEELKDNDLYWERPTS